MHADFDQLAMPPAGSTICKQMRKEPARRDVPNLLEAARGHAT
jgi:hypothetical protein